MLKHKTCFEQSKKAVKKIQIGKFKVPADLLYAYLHSIEDIGLNVEKSRTTQTLDEIRNKHHWRIVKSLGILKADDEDNLHWKWLQNKKEVREFANDLADWIEKQMKKHEATGGSVWARFRK